MKTIKQIADDIGISKTAVRKYLTDEVKTRFVQTVSGVIYIDEQGESLIKSSIEKNRPQTKFAGVSDNTGNQIADVSGQVSALINMLQSELEAKNKQLDVKDKQIEELTTTIKLQAESINADRKNELAETILDGQQKLIGEQMDKVKEQKKGFFNRFFDKKA